MLRVTELMGEDGGRALRLDGRIVAAWADVLEEHCRRLLARRERLRLDLAGVDYVDRAGVSALRRLRDADVELDGCSPLILELLTRETGP